MSLHVLVTGAVGYLGSVLCERLLKAGCRVTAVDNLIYQQRSLFHLFGRPAFSFVFGDDDEIRKLLIGYRMPKRGCFTDV